ncbi:hypothetical protein AX15_004372 [Amanita polypyramis BW_CC]|nr:hypothetical protein AX15_004372 [Amanita polypyramis BW_CC]
MAASLSPECTPLKHKYDTCFNAWFEGYLEPAVTGSSSAEERAVYSKQKADEFQANCGQIWEEYRRCVQKAVKDRGLEKLLVQAQEEYPLAHPPPPTSTHTTKSSSH